MFDLMHEFRRRIITAPVFDGDRVLGAILFEQTMDREVAGMATPRYLWERKKVVPFVKVDEGLAAGSDGVRLMKPFTKLERLLERAVRRQCSARRCVHSSVAATPAASPRSLINSSSTPGKSLTPDWCPSLNPRST